VDLGRTSIAEQQALNFRLCANLTAAIRKMEPKGVTISVGGEIGEVGGQNSTEPELRAFMQGYNGALRTATPGAAGISKISIQTGTSHGGLVLPDGSIAQVKVDFETLARLSRLAREEFGLGGAVQHGASTLPEQAFRRFAEAGAVEVHLATNFQNMLFDRIPAALRREMYAFLDKNHGAEHKSDQTEEQFYYKVRKNALGPFKSDLWSLPNGSLAEIEAAWEEQFRLLFDRLNITRTKRDVEKHIKAAKIQPPLSDYAADLAQAEDVRDLAD
jgi:fructose/tagatose bisphosphate aldolase